MHFISKSWIVVSFYVFVPALCAPGKGHINRAANIDIHRVRTLTHKGLDIYGKPKFHKGLDVYGKPQANRGLDVYGQPAMLSHRLSQGVPSKIAKVPGVFKLRTSKTSRCVEDTHIDLPGEHNATVTRVHTVLKCTPEFTSQGHHSHNRDPKLHKKEHVNSHTHKQHVLHKTEHMHSHLSAKSTRKLHEHSPTGNLNLKLHRPNGNLDLKSKVNNHNTVAKGHSHTGRTDVHNNHLHGHIGHRLTTHVNRPGRPSYFVYGHTTSNSHDFHPSRGHGHTTSNNPNLHPSRRQLFASDPLSQFLQSAGDMSVNNPFSQTRTHYFPDHNHGPMDGNINNQRGTSGRTWTDYNIHNRGQASVTPIRRAFNTYSGRRERSDRYLPRRINSQTPLNTALAPTHTFRPIADRMPPFHLPPPYFDNRFRNPVARGIRATFPYSSLVRANYFVF